MAIETLRTLPQLKEECKLKGIDVTIAGKKERKEDYVRALRNYWIQRYYGSLDRAPWSLNFMLSIDCPMLCRRYQECKEEQQRAFWESDSYVAEEKIDGSRMVILYNSETKSFDFYSRNNSVKDYLPQSYKDTILTTDKDFTYPQNFVLDCEVVSSNPNISTILGKRGTQCVTQLQSTAALLALNPEQSRMIQEDFPLRFVVFDCLYDGESLINKPWKERHTHAEDIVNMLVQKGFSCVLNKVFYTPEERRDAWQTLVLEQAKEGLVFKNVNAVYHATTSRTVDQVKMKRCLENSLLRDLDAWVTDYVESSEDKSWSNMIGGFVFSCKVLMNDGTVQIREVAKVTGIPQELREAATVMDKYGNPKLNPDWYGRVATISGQNISARAMRVTHAKIVVWRPDKDADGCEILTETELSSMVM